MPDSLPPPRVTRGADDGKSTLVVWRDADGDYHVVIEQRAGLPIGAEFCTRMGGGRSPEVRKALADLALAMAAANERDPHAAEAPR